MGFASPPGAPSWRVMSRGHGCVLNSSAVFSPIWREQIIALQRLCSAYRKTVSFLVSLSLLKFLDILTVENIFRFFVLKLTNGIKLNCQMYFMNFCDMQAVFMPIILDTQSKIIYKSYGYVQM